MVVGEFTSRHGNPPESILFRARGKLLNRIFYVAHYREGRRVEQEEGLHIVPVCPMGYR